MKKFLLLCCCVLLLSGCGIKANYVAVINKDKSMDVNIIMAYDDEFIETMLSFESGSEGDVEYTEEQKWQFIEESFSEEEDFESKGYSKSRYDQDGYKGYSYTVKINNIDEVTGDAEKYDIFGSSENINETKMFKKDGNNYVANIEFESNEEVESGESYNLGLDFKYIVTLPNKPISHNATSVSEDGKTLTWDLSSNATTSIEYEFNFGNNMLLYFIIGGAVGICVIGAIVILATNMKKSKNKGNFSDVDNKKDEQPVQPVQPAQPVQPVQPVQPAQPVQPVQPAQPTQPTQPTQPAQPAQSVQPAQPTQSVEELMNSMPKDN